MYCIAYILCRYVIHCFAYGYILYTLCIVLYNCTVTQQWAPLLFIITYSNNVLKSCFSYAEENLN